MMLVSLTSRTDALLRLFMAIFWAGGVLFVITGDVSAVERGYLLGLLAAFALLLVVGLRPQTPRKGIYFILGLQILILLAGAVLTKNLSLDYGRVGIRANAICPGFIETPMFQSVMNGDGFSAQKERIREQHKLARFGRPEEIAGAAFFLASEDSSFVTGVALPVDGGFTAGHWVGVTGLMGLE